nr:PQQ-binding-like beta-propeller repeat protein [Rhodococcus sp. (in: high G+C Gram-positive bacteria)]
MSSRLLIAGVVAAVTVTAAAFVVTQDRSTTIKRITDASPDAPGVAWVTDASASGIDGAVFADPRTGSEYPWGAGSIQIDSTVMTLAVAPDGDGPNSDAVMLGIDADTGEVRWTAPAPGLATCASLPLDGQLVCTETPYDEDPGIVTFDVDSGNSHQYDTEAGIVAATVANDHLYTADGDIEGSDVRIHRGTLDDHDADWTRPLYVSAGWEDQYADRLQVGTKTGHFDLGGGFATFDAETGAEIWATDTLDDCMTASHRTVGNLAIGVEHDCASPYAPTATTAFSTDGRVVATTPITAESYASIDDPTDASVPVVLGDAAFDRVSGTELWRDESLVYTQPATEWSDESQRSSLIAVIGDIGILQRDDSRAGIDLRTGDERWTMDEPWSIFGHEGSIVLAAMQDNLIALDIRSGHQLWSAPFDNITPGSQPTTFVDGEGGSYLLQSESKLTRLVPLP